MDQKIKSSIHNFAKRQMTSLGKWSGEGTVIH